VYFISILHTLQTTLSAPLSSKIFYTGDSRFLVFLFFDVSAAGADFDVDGFAFEISLFFRFPILIFQNSNERNYFSALLSPNFTTFVYFSSGAKFKATI